MAARVRVMFLIRDRLRASDIAAIHIFTQLSAHIIHLWAFLDGLHSTPCLKHALCITTDSAQAIVLAIRQRD
jgi:hypothetical protein